MKQYSGLWWAAILLSSAVMGGGSFVLITVLTDLPIATVIKISLALILIGDLILAFIMQAVSPTRVAVGPGDRHTKYELPKELGTVIADFEDGRGSISIRGERWHARQTSDCNGRLTTGDLVRILEREGLMLVVAAAE